MFVLAGLMELDELIELVGQLGHTIASAPREEVQETQNVKIIVKTYLGMCFKV